MKFLVLLLFAITLFGVFFIAKNLKQSSQPIVSIEPSNTVAPSQGQIEIDKTQKKVLEQGGSSYLDKSGVYSLLYPTDYTLDKQYNDTLARLTKIGATQKGQTELYDGVLIILEAVSLGNLTLDAWVDNRIKETTADGTLTVTIPRKVTTLNNYKGYTYSTRGLGEAENLILQKDASSSHAVFVTISINDPQNIGYKKEVDTVLSTLNILK